MTLQFSNTFYAKSQNHSIKFIYIDVQFIDVTHRIITTTWHDVSLTDGKFVMFFKNFKKSKN